MPDITMLSVKERRRLYRQRKRVLIRSSAAWSDEATLVKELGRFAFGSTIVHMPSDRGIDGMIHRFIVDRIFKLREEFYVTNDEFDCYERMNSSLKNVRLLNTVHTSNKRLHEVIVFKVFGCASTSLDDLLWQAERLKIPCKMVIGKRRLHRYYAL